MKEQEPNKKINGDTKGGTWKNNITEKWGEAVTSGDTGFQAVPDILIKNQTLLGLDTVDMTVLLNILIHWWEPEDMPHPRLSVIAKRMGTSVRTVERRVKKIEQLGYIQRLPSEQKTTSDGRQMTVRRFNLDGLVVKLQHLAKGARTVAIKKH